MAERGPSLEPPIEQLKLLGPPRVQETDEPAYEVYLQLSRMLTPGEHDAFNAWQTHGIKSPAGWVHPGSDGKHLTIRQTTIEKVADCQDFFKDLVAKIAAEGAEYRNRAVEEQRRAADADKARETERARRRNLAKGINFD
jgi:hypothetical protein